mmetsp:Transcript_66368/g.190817  ORF Transcript_66368/g.190817 Transcript_66368/m.190817 type:complete len:225 (-) Transcript_66368:367-1041(-)
MASPNPGPRLARDSKMSGRPHTLAWVCRLAAGTCRRQWRQRRSPALYKGMPLAQSSPARPSWNRFDRTTLDPKLPTRAATSAGVKTLSHSGLGRPRPNSFRRCLRRGVGARCACLQERAEWHRTRSDRSTHSAPRSSPPAAAPPARRCAAAGGRCGAGTRGSGSRGSGRSPIIAVFRCIFVVIVVLVLFGGIVLLGRVLLVLGLCPGTHGPSGTGRAAPLRSPS